MAPNVGFGYTFQRPLIQNDILEATRFAGGLKNHEMLEVNGKQGSLRFDLLCMEDHFHRIRG
jgi:hypothetical protein